MKRLRPLFLFICSGGLLIFTSPYFIHEAAVKHLSWFVPIIAIPIYAVLSYSAFKAYLPRIIGKAGTSVPQNEPVSESKRPRH